MSDEAGYEFTSNVFGGSSIVTFRSPGVNETQICRAESVLNGNPVSSATPNGT